MVSITISKKGLMQRIGRKASEAKVLEALPQIKASVDKVEGDEIYVEVTGDRPDLLSVQGIARAARGFLGIEKGLPKFQLINDAKRKVIVDKSVAKVRPIIVSAFVENVKIDGQGFKDLIQTQEKLTLTHGRRRRKVAIGVHDAAHIKFPLTYKAIPKNSPIAFIPLNKTQKMTVEQVMREHEKGMEYGFILSDKTHYPVIFDANGEIISFPPIINSAKTTVTTRTTSLFLDVTGTNFEACNAALAILCQDLADDGAKVYALQTGSRTTPETEPEKMPLDAAKASQLIGLDLTPAQISECLKKQRIETTAKGNKIEAHIPRYRTDFLHWIDLVEEIAIGYGYNRFIPKTPSIFTIGKLSGETMLEEKLRDLMAGAGFTEQWTYILTSSAKHLPGEVAKIKNPVSSDYDAIRSTLLPSLFETLEKNTHESYPQKVFEAGEVVVKDEKHHMRSATQKRLACVSAHGQANLSELTPLITQLGKALGKELGLKKTEKPHFILGRCASIWHLGREIGVIGEVHPALLQKMQVEVPVVALEITV
ncbi:TPA: phenylalanine--tRNA ligase subunit beta [Candidatus Micrarchaeota archaeon]|nr:phenylalanine--tRNA ligase subunit beta [Candidatus Micrarchaeota archaeon]